jgi:chemotaxis methyl-accepting protein methylase
MSRGLAADAWAAYRDLLAQDRGEYAHLFDAFSVNVTEFFRDVPVWQVMRTRVMPSLIAEKERSEDPHLRIWSAGCSTCEEAYSIALIIRELLPQGCRMTLCATDIDDDALHKAAAGIYFKESMKNIAQIEPRWITEYFTPLPVSRPNTVFNAYNERFEIDERIRHMVALRKNNFLMDPPPLPTCDLIFCRNAMIYLQPAMKKKLVRLFYRALGKNGVLVIGKSELICMEKAEAYFIPLDAKEHIYVKAPVPPPEARADGWML